MRADDRELLRAAATRLSDVSRYQRFHTFLTDVPDDLLDRLLDLDHRDREAIIALTPDEREIVGGARYSRDRDRPETADLAVAIDDEWHQRGLASYLLWHLARRAEEVGIKQFTAVVLTTNQATLELLQRLGPATLTVDGLTVDARMDVDRWPEADRSGATSQITADLLFRDAVISRAMRAWLGLSTEVASTLVISVAAIVRGRRSMSSRHEEQSPG